VARLPGRGETVLADSVTRSLGGKGANQATALRRLGGEVAIVGCVGDDDFGEAFLDFFRQEGIETGFVHRDPSAPTGMAFPMVLPGGGNAIVAAPSASMRLPEAAVAGAAARIRQAAALLVQLEVPAGAVAAAMAVAREAGVPDTRRRVFKPATGSGPSDRHVHVSQRVTVARETGAKPDTSTAPAGMRKCSCSRSRAPRGWSCR